MTLQELKDKFSDYIIMNDENILDVIFATIIGNTILDKDPIWLMIVAPSSAGKTTMIAPAGGIKSVFFVDDLTEKTLLSGYKVRGKEMSLLKQIGSGIMAFSDFTSILSKNPMSRGEILTQLKLVYDRKISKYTGTGGIEWEGKIGMLAAATPDIYTFLESGRSMGERFVYYWLEQADNEKIIDKQKSVEESSKQVTDIMKTFYDDYFISIVDYMQNRNQPVLRINNEQSNRIRNAAIFCVSGKATVRTNFKTGKPDAIPNIAGVGRDIKIFNTMLLALQLMDAHDNKNNEASVTDKMIDIIEKCAYSSINRERRKIMEILVQNKGESMTASQIGAQEGLGLERDAIDSYLRPLHAVGLVKKSAKTNSFKWYIDDEWQIKFITNIFAHTQEINQAQGLEIADNVDNVDNVDKDMEDLWNSV